MPETCRLTGTNDQSTYCRCTPPAPAPGVYHTGSDRVNVMYTSKVAVTSS